MIAPSFYCNLLIRNVAKEVDRMPDIVAATGYWWSRAPELVVDVREFMPFCSIFVTKSQILARTIYFTMSRECFRTMH